MKYTKPQLLNTKAASAAIMGQEKKQSTIDNNHSESPVAYRSDE
jgi:hypothetical protein